MQIEVHATDPSITRRFRFRAMLVGVPGIVAGWAVLGQAALIVVVVTAVIVFLLLWSGPRVNLRIYGTRNPDGALLHVCSAIERRSGTLDITPGNVRWSPWKRNATRVTAWEVDSSHIRSAVLFGRRGFPASCRLEIDSADAESRELTVFAKAVVVERALRST